MSKPEHANWVAAVLWPLPRWAHRAMWRFFGRTPKAHVCDSCHHTLYYSWEVARRTVRSRDE